MIKKPTVLVLGAGASVPYGYPTGWGLRTKVISALGDSTFHELGFDPAECKAFRQGLLYSDQPSVDAFLEHRPEFMQIGKCAIAHALLPYEGKNLWSLTNDEEKWYRYLLDQLGANPKQVARNNISILTFNYDRSLEHYLFVCLTNRFKLGQAECSTLMTNIRIRHVYGQLGFLQWQQPGSVPPQSQPGSRPLAPEQLFLAYGRPVQSLKKPELEKAAACIRILSEVEHERDDEQFGAARQLLRQAECVVFLGFGYHRTNLARLRIADLKGAITIIGTGYGIKAPERDVLRDQYGIHVDSKDRSVMPFLLEVGPLSDRGAIVDWDR